MIREPKNVVASVLARLRNSAAATGFSFNQVLQQYAIERFLYRVSQSAHADGVILKGALLLRTIGIPHARPTMDIDLLRKGRADRASLIELVKDCTSITDESDGITFITESVLAEDIAKDAEYQGTRIVLAARMDNVKLKIQIDFGVGDVMVPGPRLIEYPAFLERRSVRLLAYPIESAIAEKLQAMVTLGNANSRMKDFYDIWTCSNHLDFSSDTLLKAIAATFKHRDTPVPEETPEALTPAFVDSHRVQWNAFVRKIGETELIDTFGRVVADIREFAMPALDALVRGERLSQQWQAGKGWADLKG